MDNNKLKKLSLKKVKISNLSPSEMQNVVGGVENIQILSIGHACSVDNSCSRLTRRGDLRCSECQSSDNGTCAAQLLLLPLELMN